MSLVDPRTLAQISSMPGRMVAFGSDGFALKDPVANEAADRLMEIFKPNEQIHGCVTEWLEFLIGIVRPSYGQLMRDDSAIPRVIDSLHLKTIENFGRQGNLIIALALKALPEEIGTLRNAVIHSIGSFRADMKCVNMAKQDYYWMHGATAGNNP